jgi:polysaccharide export outer membrane protein
MIEPYEKNRIRGWAPRFLAACISLGAAILPVCAQSQPGPQNPPTAPGQTTQDNHQRLEPLGVAPGAQTGAVQVPVQVNEYRIGPEDLLDISVFEAPELNCSARVSAGGEISMPLLGVVKAIDLTPRELETVLNELLRRSYMKDPHVGVTVREMQSHTVSVVGAVKNPGVFQIRGSRSLLEIISLAGGLEDDAGGTLQVLRGAGLPAKAQPAAESETTIEVSLKDLLNFHDPRFNVSVYPGDIVKVNRAGIVYVIGAVRKPGGFVVRNNENISALQALALALAEGLTSTSAKSKARIIRTNPGTGERSEIPLDFGKIMASKVPDPILYPRDIIFVPSSAAKSAFYRGADIAASSVSSLVIYRGW